MNGSEASWTDSGGFKTQVIAAKPDDSGNSGNSGNSEGPPRAAKRRGLIAGSTPATLKLRPVPAASRVEVASAGAVTTFTLHLSKDIDYDIFTLADPYRVVIDLPQVDFHMPARGNNRGSGLISAYRYGLFAVGKSRIVLDVTGPVAVKRLVGGKINGRTRRTDSGLLKIVLEPTDDIGFLLKPPPKQRKTKPPPEESRPLAREGLLSLLRDTLYIGNENKRSDGRQMPAGRTPGSVVASGSTAGKDAANSSGGKPVVVIDAGHGGVDAGTVGLGNGYEKHVTLAVAKRLAAILRRSGRYKVVLTRTTDTFVSLDDRVEISEKNKANLFISIHADAIANRSLARHVRGATIYTLSERASDEQARQLAIKENAVDALAGIAASRGKKDRQVKTILIDLLKRETANFSRRFSNLLINQFKGRISLHNKNSKAAAFRVLKQSQTPSVLIELGYMSNRSDERMLRSPRFQKKVSKTVSRAIDRYFARQVAGSK